MDICHRWLLRVMYVCRVTRQDTEVLWSLACDHSAATKCTGKLIRHSHNLKFPTVLQLVEYKGSLRPARNIHSGGDDNFAQVSHGLRQRDSRGYPHQCVSFVVAFATMYYSSDEEEALLFLGLEDEENSRFVFLLDHCRSYIFFFPPRYAKPPQEKEKEVGPRNQCRA